MYSYVHAMYMLYVPSSAWLKLNAFEVEDWWRWYGDGIKVLGLKQTWSVKSRQPGSHGQVQKLHERVVSRSPAAISFALTSSLNAVKWLVQSIIVFFQLQFMGFENLSRDHHGILWHCLTAQCEPTTCQRSEVQSSFALVFFVAQIRLVAASSTEKPSTIVSCEFGMLFPLWCPQACMVYSLPPLPRTTAESPHQKRGSYYDVQGKSWRSCTFADSMYKIPISKIIKLSFTWYWELDVNPS